ncbi:MAG: amidohydrolase, partial [Bacteroidales bacterium]|nr:amidohydrolase [Bacteroidales bacterium]
MIKGIMTVHGKRDVLIKGERIEKIADNIDFNAQKLIDGTKKHLLPGFINMHTHAAMTLMRGIGEDMVLKEWLYKKIWPTEQKLDEELVYWGTKLACLEMIKSGTTCFNDQYWYLESAVKATAEMGLRSVQPFVILDLYDPSKFSKIKEDCFMAWEKSQSWGGANRFAIGIHSPYSVSQEMLLWGSEFARERNLLVHIHVSETEGENRDSIAKHGVSPTLYLDRCGVLGPNVIAAHCLWMDDRDIEIFSERGVKVVHNINSNLKIASGYKFRYNEFRDAGVTVTLGTDGCASSNNLDMLEAMKIAALVQKGWRGDPTALPINELLSLAT